MIVMILLLAFQESSFVFVIDAVYQNATISKQDSSLMPISNRFKMYYLVSLFAMQPATILLTVDKIVSMRAYLLFQFTGGLYGCTLVGRYAGRTRFLFKVN